MKTWKEHRILEWWESIFASNGGAEQGNYTADVYVMGSMRLIITADPENVKHLLASDFGSWGKGKLL
jgi:hypothetical protein